MRSTNRKFQDEQAKRQLEAEARQVEKLANRLREELGEDGYEVLQREADRLSNLASNLPRW